MPVLRKPFRGQELLFDRVYALRVRAFARNYGRAEVDMRYSMQSDMVGLHDFLDVLKAHGPEGLITRLERGQIWDLNEWSCGGRTPPATPPCRPPAA